MTKILFVYHGNICRSPMAEFILKDMVQKKGIQDRFVIESAATTTEEIWRGKGNPIYPPAMKTLREHGIGTKDNELGVSLKRARLMRTEDYDAFDYIIGMDTENFHDMKDIAGGDPDNKISLLLDYTKRPGSVADPWYTGNFDATWRDCEEGCTDFLVFLTQKGII